MSNQIQLADCCPKCQTTKLTVPRLGRVGCPKCDWSIAAYPAGWVTSGNNEPDQAALVPLQLATQVYRLLESYAQPQTYTYRERVGGVLKGCPRGAQVTVEQLALRVRILRDRWHKEVVQL